MDELYRQMDKDIKYMPAWWQNETGVMRIGEYEDVVFFKISGLVVSDEPIEEGIRYAKKSELLLDHQMVAATQRKRSRR
jgi:hypothetical protein